MPTLAQMKIARKRAPVQEYEGPEDTPQSQRTPQESPEESPESPRVRLVDRKIARKSPPFETGRHRQDVRQPQRRLFAILSLMAKRKAKNDRLQRWGNSLAEKISQGRLKVQQLLLKKGKLLGQMRFCELQDYNDAERRMKEVSSQLRQAKRSVRMDQNCLKNVEKKIRYEAIEKGYYLGGHQAFSICSRCPPVPIEVEPFVKEKFKEFKALDSLLDEEEE